MTKNKPKPPRVSVPLTDIEGHVIDQLAFLRKSARNFDAGDRSEFRRMALAIRILVYDNPPSSTSLLNQVGLDSLNFVSSASAINPTNLLNEFSLAALALGPGPPLVPLCQTPISAQLRKLPRAAWLHEHVLRDRDRHLFTRWDFIRVVANQAGGAHVDPQIEERYYNLSQSGGFGLSGMKSGNAFNIDDIEKVYIRQIAWEVIESISPAWARHLGNKLCDCGSGRKSRYCCNKEPKAT